MNLEINDELALLRHDLRRFTTDKLEPIARHIDETGQVPEGTLELLREHGYLGMRMPSQYGGSECDLPTYCLVLEEFSRAHRVFTLMLDASSGLNPIAISEYGSQFQKDSYLAGLCSGELLASFALTEPDAGSDAQAITTRAIKTETGWSLSGRKHYISGAHVADVIMVMAVTDKEKKARGGITAFLVNKGTPGLEVTRVDKTIGSDPIQLAELTFEACEIPDSSVLGEVGHGFKIAMSSLTSGRMGVACSCIGAADRLLEMSTEYAKQRSTFGEPLAKRQAIQWMLADSATEIALARSLTYEVLRKIQAGQDIGVGASMCKLYCAEMVGKVADRAVQIHGGVGLIRGYPVERFYRDVRHYRVGEGSSEIQRMMIARSVLG